MSVHSLRRIFWQPSKYYEIIRLSIPLILASAGLVLMQFVDGMFLAWYSPATIAAVGTAGMVSYAVNSFILGVVGYTSPYVANLVGADKNGTVGKLVWQGIYIALAAGLASICLAPASTRFFLLCGHDSQLAAAEGTYLRIMLLGGVFQFIAVAVSGFFSGRGDNVRLMLAQITGQLVNIVGDYVLIFGKCGLPEMGISGAALATVISSIVTMVILLAMFFRSRHNVTYGTISGWRFDYALCRRLLSFSISSGVMLLIDAIIWTLFLLLVGRIDVVALAASSIVFRINMVAFQPIIGLGRAAAACIGKSHGAKNHPETIEYTMHCVAMCQLWMMLIAASYFFCGEEYLEIFRSRDGEDFQAVMETGLNIMRFLALYCLADGLNVGFASALQAVGDTKWVAIVMGSCTLFFSALLCIGMKLNCGIYGMWTIATVFVMVMPLFWIYRFCGGKWKKIQVA